MNPLQQLLLGVILTVIIFFSTSYFLLSRENKKLQTDIELSKTLHKTEIHTIKKDNFEDSQHENKQLRIKNLQKELKHEDLNLSIGSHSITYGN